MQAIIKISLQQNNLKKCENGTKKFHILLLFDEENLNCTLHNKTICNYNIEASALSESLRKVKSEYITNILFSDFFLCSTIYIYIYILYCIN